MKLYDSGRVPNPRRVRIFLAEKGIAPPELHAVDLARGEHKSPAFAALNPYLETPVLELDDGTAIAESIAICRYFEALHPEPPLFGRDAREIALVEMWNRRAEFSVFAAATAIFRHGHPGMAAAEVPQVPDWAEANRGKLLVALERLDRALARTAFVAGPDFTVADITAGVAIDFLRVSRTSVPETFAAVRAWHAGLAARPSWSA